MLTKPSCAVVSAFALCLAAMATLFFVVGSPAAALDTTRYVANDGTDDGACDSPAGRCETIQYAVEQATTGDTIRVAAGAYTGVLTRPVPAGYGSPPASGLASVIMSGVTPEGSCAHREPVRPTPHCTSSKISAAS